MQKIHFSTQINAPKEKVWEMLWDLDAYKAWTTAFAEGSSAKTDNWEEGSQVLFVDPKGNGMVSMVAVNKPNEYMSFRHLGEVREGVEDTTSDRVKIWSGSTENYTLVGDNGITTLSVEMDIPDEYKEMFEKMWPIALEKVKALSEGTAKTMITIQAEVNAPVEKVWTCWTTPEHIMQWNNASGDWHSPAANNDLQTGGKFSYTMAAKDGSYSFDFSGVYTEVIENETIQYTMDDGRNAIITFMRENDQTFIEECFEAENTNTLALQREGWQAILDNFKKHTESND